MPQFRYVARGGNGQLLEGVVEGNDRAAAIRQVELQKCVPIKIEAVAAAKGPESARSDRSASSQKKSAASARQAEPKLRGDSAAVAPSSSAGSSLTMTHNQQYLFTEQLANLLGAGMTLDEALGILVRRMKQPKLQGISKGLHQALVDGRSLSQALRDYPRVFSPLYVNLVAAGEASGALADILRRLVAFLADVKALRDRVQQALIYPALLVVAGMGLVVIFITVMVPQLTGFFKETGQVLPPSTKLLLQANYLITTYWWALGIALVCLYTGFKALTRTPQGRKGWDTFVWKIPVYSSVLRHRFYAQFARTLGTLVDNGVTLLRALELLRDTSGNEYVRQQLVEVQEAVVDGATLSTAAAEQKIFPELFIDMMAVGEQTGRFGATMHNIAEVYERELDKQVKVLSALIPPLVMMVIAIFVGFVVYGILSAVFSLTQGLHGRSPVPR
jgi:type II secretory pathway component PulF